MKLKYLFAIVMALGVSMSAQAAENYAFDIKGQHAFIQFKVKHLGYSWILGEFRTFDGSFSYDEKHPEKNKVSVRIESNSIDTNHAERNKHLRSPDFFDVEKYPIITFVSTSYEDKGNGKALIHGTLTLRGVI